MRSVAAILASIVLATVIADAFQTVVVARHARSLPRMTRAFYRLTWLPFSWAARFIGSERLREHWLGLYGPLSLLMLLALWALGLIAAFAALRWSADPRFAPSPSRFPDALYVSAATFFTLGAGDPQYPMSKFLAVAEAGFGFTFLGLVIGYLPVLYQAYSNRELRILLLDARAGSPPSAVEFLSRSGGSAEKLEQRLASWEEWALDLLQYHLSYPMLAYYRSQHANQSWLGALTAMVDVSALVMAASAGDLKRQAEFTFAAGRHALVHTASILYLRPCLSDEERVDAAEIAHLRSAISASQAPLQLDRVTESELRKLRATYEPYAIALGNHLLMEVPRFVPAGPVAANWQIRSWHR